MSGNVSLNAAVERVVIVGTGLLGASLGLGLRAAGYRGRVVGVGRRAQTVNRAVALGCMESGTTRLEEALADGAMVVLATPISVFAGALAALGKSSVKHLIVTDVGSTKQHVCAEARRHLREPGRFIGAHPMAGSEQHGPDAAKADLFTGKPCILTPEAGSDAEAKALVRHLWEEMGMNVVEMTPAEHDRRVALISHLPHAVACMLVNLSRRSEAVKVASTGFRDTTRVASGDPVVWRDIFSSNRAAVIEAVDAFTEELTAFRALLSKADDERLIAWLRDAKQCRDAWLGAQTPASDEHE